MIVLLALVLSGLAAYLAISFSISNVGVAAIAATVFIVTILIEVRGNVSDSNDF